MTDKKNFIGTDGWHMPMAADQDPKDMPKTPEHTITEEQFNKVAYAAPKGIAKLFVPHINKWAHDYGMATKEIIAAFLPQLVHETGHFKYLREIWGPIPQQKRYSRDFRYAWHADLPKKHRNSLAYQLGNDKEGDGSLFRGRGCIMTTGKANYRKVSVHLFGDERLLSDPSLLEQPEYAIRAAMYYFSTRVIPKVKDLANVELVTKEINGGYWGLEERKALYDISKTVFV